jgi:hypothetical protein
VTAFDDTGLTLLDGHHRDDTGLDYRVYTDPESERAFLRVDDGHRFVGLEVPWSELEASGPSGPFRRLERELGDRRRLDPDPQPDSLPPTPPLTGQSPEEFVAAAWHRLIAEAAETSQYEEGVARATEAFRWGARPDATLVDGSHRVDWSAVNPTTEAFRRAGEAMAQLGPPLAAVGAGVAAAVRAESDRAALRAVCVDQAMYERALSVAGAHGWVDLGRTPDAEVAGIVTAASADPPGVARNLWQDLLAAWRRLEGHNPPVRFDTGVGVVERLRSQARSQGPAPTGSLGGLFDIPIREDATMDPDAWRLEYADGQRFESHICRWERVASEELLGRFWHRCVLVWSDGSRCASGTANPAEVRRTERRAGLQPTGGIHGR